MTCLPRIMFPDAVVRFRATQTCYFYPGMHIGFTWTSVGLLQREENARMTPTQGTHYTQQAYSYAHTHTHTYRQTYRHTQTPQNSRLWQIMIRSADGCKRFLLIFLFLGQLLTAAFSDAANLLCELLTFLHRSKAQRDGDECAPAAVRAD